MFSEILKIIPRIDSKDLARMERTLQSRFTKIAKGFGKGLTAAVKGGGIAAIGLALIDKILNPLKETQEAIDRMLSSSDDISTNAKQFNTTSGKLFKLVQLAKATGLDQDNLFQLINKFQTAVAENRADPTKATSVANFANNEDTAASFFEFIQSLKAMEDKGAQLLVQQQVFGEKQILKMADFLQSDFPKLVADVGLDKVASSKLTGDIDKLGALKDLSDVLTARREVKDVQTKAGIINEGMVRSRDVSEQIALKRENARIQNFKDISAISQTVERVMTLVEDGVGMLGKFINFIQPTLNRIVSMLENFSKASIFKSWFGKGKDK